MALLVWELWLCTGRARQAAESAWMLVNRLAYRLALDLPLPCARASAGLPWDPARLEPLVRAWFESRQAAGPRFEDRPSTLLPAALYVACAHAPQPPPHAAETLASFASRPDHPVFPQTWQPPDDAPATWYEATLQDRGDTHVYRLELGPAALVEAFGAFVHGCAPSLADRWQRPAIDRIAWKRWRNSPPLAVLLAAPATPPPPPPTGPSAAA